MRRLVYGGLAVLAIAGVVLATRPEPEPPAPGVMAPEGLRSGRIDASPRRGDADDLAYPPDPLPVERAPFRAGEAPARPPNVVLLIGCTVRRDQTSVFGAPPEVTPFLLDMAQHGTVFTDVISAAPWTRPAVTAILTGQHPISIGMVDPSLGRDVRKLGRSAVTLAEQMTERGYRTIGATANPNILPEFGFDQGFEFYQGDMGARWRTKLQGHEIAEGLLAQVDAGRDDRPLYLQALLYDAHEPRRTSPTKREAFEAEGIPDRVVLYRAELREMDHGLELLVDGLRERGFTEDNTLFVFVADHGEGMGWPGHHGFAHGQYLYTSAISVPWILRGAGVAEGHQVAGLASQTDVAATILGLIGAPMTDPPPDARDWTAQVRGASDRTDRTEAWSDTWFQESNRAARVDDDRICQMDFGSGARLRRKKKFADGCFDRAEDPWMERPLDDGERMGELARWRAARTAEMEAAGGEDAVVDEGLGKQLEALGYVE